MIQGWIFPRYCFSCGAPLLRGETDICVGCLLRLPQTLFWQAPTHNEGYFRLAPHVRGLLGVIAGFWYVAGSPLRAWVQAAKYQGNPHLLYHSARLLAHIIQQESAIPIQDLRGVLAVPISAERLRRRGYNQAEWVAKAFSEVWGIPVLKGYWQRRAGGASQLTKTRTQRWTSLQAEFMWVKLPPFPVVVVDDVLTTGATLAAALRDLPPERQLWVCTVGITQRR